MFIDPVYLVRLFERSTNVKDGKKRKDEGLDAGHENPKPQENNRDEQWYETHEDRKDHVVAEHVAEKAEGQA